MNSFTRSIITQINHSKSKYCSITVAILLKNKQTNKNISPVLCFCKASYKKKGKKNYTKPKNHPLTPLKYFFPLLVSSVDKAILPRDAVMAQTIHFVPQKLFFSPQEQKYFLWVKQIPPFRCEYLSSMSWLEISICLCPFLPASWKIASNLPFPTSLFSEGEVTDSRLESCLWYWNSYMVPVIQSILIDCMEECRAVLAWFGVE